MIRIDKDDIIVRFDNFTLPSLIDAVYNKMNPFQYLPPDHSKKFIISIWQIGIGNDKDRTK